MSEVFLKGCKSIDYTSWAKDWDDPAVVEAFNKHSKMYVAHADMPLMGFEDFRCALNNLLLDDNEKFGKAYQHAMKVLDNYIKSTHDKIEECKERGLEGSTHHYISKEQFMRTARDVIKENIRVYLEHPELFKDGE